MKTITVTLAEKEYTVSMLPHKASMEWRQKFAEPLEQIIGGLEYTGSLMSGGMNNREVGDLVGEIGRVLLGGIGKTLIGSIDLVVEMLFAYSPELQAHREEIEAAAYDDELIKAFAEVLKIAYPFSAVLTAFRGQAAVTTKKS